MWVWVLCSVSLPLVRTLMTCCVSCHQVMYFMVCVPSRDTSCSVCCWKQEVVLHLLRALRDLIVFTWIR